MDLGYTEFSYGYAFTENLIRSSSGVPDKAPVFPNLVQEGKVGGFDVEISLPSALMYFQYKIPELLVKNNAREVSRLNLLGICAPYFRMKLMKGSISKQHRLLMELENKNNGNVYYATPIMMDLCEFNYVYICGCVHRRSYLFSPQDIGVLPPSRQHVVVYREGTKWAWVCSDPKKIHVYTFDEIRHEVIRKGVEQGGGNLFDVIENARSALDRLSEFNFFRYENYMRNTIEERLIYSEERFRDRSEEREIMTRILLCRDFARVYFGLDMVVAQSRST